MVNVLYLPLAGCVVILFQSEVVFSSTVSTPNYGSRNLKPSTLGDMNVGTQLLMGLYITVAVLLSVVPFTIYLYIICKKTRLSRSVQRLLNKARGIQEAEHQETNGTNITWPYTSRDIESDAGVSNGITMIDLPSYDEVMKNKQLYTLKTDVKIVYHVGNDVEPTSRHRQEEHINMAYETGDSVQDLSERTNPVQELIPANISVQRSSAQSNNTTHNNTT